MSSGLMKLVVAHHVVLCALSQAPGNTIISRQVAPSTIVRQGCPTPPSLAATTTLHRPPILQVTPSAGVKIRSYYVHLACRTLFCVHYWLKLQTEG